MTKTSAINVAKKLKALAEKATGAEAESAKVKLRSYCIKHNIDPEDYSTDFLEAEISFKNNQEKILLNNIITMILESNRVPADTKNMKVYFKCTQKQLKNIRDAYEHYKKVYYDYADALAIALIAKNKIQNNSAATERDMGYEMTEEEQQEFDKIKKDLEKEFEKEISEMDKEPTESETVTPDKSTIDKNKQREMIEKLLYVMDETPWVPSKSSGLFLN